MMKGIHLLRQATTRCVPALLLLVSGAAAWAEPYTPPDGLGRPARRESAGTRGCVLGYPAELIALMPENNVGWTTEAYPRFYWYLPTSLASFVEFTLEKPLEGEEEAEVIYQTRFAVTGDPGIVSVQLPETTTMPPLVEGDSYRWQVAIFCNPNSENGDLQVDGWIERQSPDAHLEMALHDASESDKVGLYASQGYWFNAVDQLVMLQAAAPENMDLQARWAEFLTSVGLDLLIDQPISSNHPIP